MSGEPERQAGQTPAGPHRAGPELRRLMRSSSMRLAFGLVALVSLISVVTMSLAYVKLRADIAAGIQRDLDQIVARFDTAHDPDTLGALVRAEALSADPQRQVFVFITPAGAQVGNAYAAMRDGQVYLSPPDGGQSLARFGYASRAVPLAGGILIVAQSREPLHDLRQTFLSLLAVSLVPTLALSVGLALLFAWSGARRTGRIVDTLDRLTAGDLQARVDEDARRRDDLARIAQGLNKMAAAQEGSVAALRQVSADIAHDLKTPVQRISVMLKDLCDRLPEDGDEAAIADRAASEADRAVAVFQSLLQIAQIEGGSVRARFAPVDLGALLSTFAEIYEPSAEESGHVLRLDPLPEGAVVTVQGDQVLLGQMVANLIENALRHTPAGSHVGLSLGQGADGVVLEVADNGPGIPEGERGLVTRRLYRLESSRTTPGNGLGLSLVAAVTDLHGATLNLADNAPGLVARVSFPPA